MYPTWISGDGGPAVVLQRAAAVLWDGTRTSDTDETDYDAICALEEDGIHVLQRHDRDMLVLSDCSWSSTFLKLAGDEIAILQNISIEDDPQPFVQNLRQTEPDTTYEMQINDSTLRLLVGADVGDGSVYDYDDCPITPGPYQVWVYLKSEAYVAILVSIAPTAE